MFNLSWFGVGACLGSIALAILTEKNISHAGFVLGAFVGVFITIAGFFTDEELETNRFATLKDDELLAYEEH